MTEIVAEYCSWLKILKLVEEKEVVLKDSIPRRKMSLRTTLKEIKKEEEEKFQGVFYPPRIPFIPE